MAGLLISHSSKDDAIVELLALQRLLRAADTRAYCCEGLHGPAIVERCAHDLRGTRKVQR